MGWQRGGGSGCPSAAGVYQVIFRMAEVAVPEALACEILE